ncbi:MAG: hypothetical protein F6K39_07545 [Okeania sp. SIO3B3]|nr:hypothetical protein [Okeania sp. SIO3B3]
MLKKAKCGEGGKCEEGGEKEKVGGIVVPVSLLWLSVKSLNFLVTQAEKLALFFAPKRLKLLSVSAFRFNQQALIINY